jgi:hypothetical protein
MHQALEERVIVGRIVSGRTSTNANVSVKRRRLLNELEAGNVAEIDSHLSTTASGFFAAGCHRFTIGFAGDVMIFLVTTKIAAGMHGVDERRRVPGIGC